MSSAGSPAVSSPARGEQIASLMEQLRPQVEQALRHLVERSLEVPEAQEFGTLEYEFRDAGLNLVNQVRQATLASRKKRGT
jgi:hypothetical protein